jgi:MFS superfamily sulfate permease-like transporter
VLDQPPKIASPDPVRCGGDILIQVARELHSHGISLALAQVHPPTLELWRRAGLSEVVGEDDIFPSIQDAVDALTRTSSLIRTG